MALIDCDECGKEVSDRADKCPNCGNPINEYDVTLSSYNDIHEESMGKGCLQGCVLMFISFIIFGIIVMVFLKLMGAL